MTHTKTLPVPRVQLEKLPSELLPIVQEWINQQHQQRQRAVFHDDSLSFGAPSLQVDVRQDAFHYHLDVLDSSSFEGLECIAGLDISFHPNNEGKQGIATLVVCSFPSMKLMHSISRPVDIRVPYVPSFLSFREEPCLSPLFDSLPPELRSKIQLVFVDGNGRLHSRQAGSAVSIGQSIDMPTIGVAKEFFPIHQHQLPSEPQAQSEDLSRPWQASQKGMREHCRQCLTKRGDWLGIYEPTTNEVLGAAILTSPQEESKNPVFVSSGHRVSLETALQLTMACCPHARVPEPIRMADRIGAFLHALRPNFLAQEPGETGRDEAKRLWGT